MFEFARYLGAVYVGTFLVGLVLVGALAVPVLNFSPALGILTLLVGSLAAMFAAGRVKLFLERRRGRKP